MKTIELYVDKHRLFPNKISAQVDKNLGLVVCIPCFDEPDILPTLESIWFGKRAEKKTEVLLLFNASTQTPMHIKETNRASHQQVVKWAQSHHDNLLCFHSILEENLSAREAGVGLARKILMDEAVARLAQAQTDGILISLDADTLCEANYLPEIAQHYHKFPKTNGTSLAFQHRIEELATTHQLAMLQYETYLHYIVAAYRFVGHPHAFHTIGSAFTVRASAYCKQGGMNRRQAGEDFYFIQKIAQLGHFYQITNTKVYPSARFSNRVPFGTGKALEALVSEGEELLCYNFYAFIELKAFFEQLPLLFKISEREWEELVYHKLGGLIKSWLIEENFWEKLLAVNQNSASFDSFCKNFFQVFSIFQIIKYLNFAHQHFLLKASISQNSLQLLKALEVKVNDYSIKGLLQLIRSSCLAAN